MLGTAVFASTTLRLRHTVAALWAGPPDLPRQLRLERRLIMGRWLGIVTFSLALATHALPMEETVRAYGVLVVAAFYNLTISRLLRLRQMDGLFGILPTIGDGLLCAA